MAKRYSKREYDRLYPGAADAERNNALDGTGADIPGGSNEDIKQPRGQTAGEQAGHGRKVGERDRQRGDPAQPSDSADYPTRRPI